MNHAEIADLKESIECLRRSFAMQALAIVSTFEREKLFKKKPVKISVDGIVKEVEEEVPELKDLPSYFRATRLPSDIADKLRTRVARGDVTCIVRNPEPFTWLTFKLEDGNEVRTIYGIWVGRAASWRGKINTDALPHIGAMTPAEAEAKGIPVPNWGKEG